MKSKLWRKSTREQSTYTSEMGRGRDSTQGRDWSRPSPWGRGLALNGSEEALTTTEGSAVLSPCRAEHTAPTEVPVRSHPGELPLCLSCYSFVPGQEGRKPCVFMCLIFIYLIRTKMLVCRNRLNGLFSIIKVTAMLNAQVQRI